MRVDEQHSGEAREETELILELLVVSSLSPHEADGFVSEVVDGLSEGEVTPLMISR